MGGQWCVSRGNGQTKRMVELPVAELLIVQYLTEIRQNANLTEHSLWAAQFA